MEQKLHDKALNLKVFLSTSNRSDDYDINSA